ncbi:hypothetical protein Ddc_12091 [Ditylenchus destructor]|nr:hypothetical protein Ddc_12091 [Ditylenchus destructor]
MSTSDDFWDQNEIPAYEPKVVLKKSINFSEMQLDEIQNITFMAFRNSSEANAVVDFVLDKLKGLMPGDWLCAHSSDEITTNFSNEAEQALVIYNVDFFYYLLIQWTKPKEGHKKVEQGIAGPRNDDHPKIENSAATNEFSFYVLLFCAVMIAFNSILLLFGIFK